MIIHRATLDTCGQETDTVIVIDVLRAFTTAAYAFWRGTSEILLASTIEHAFALKSRFPDALLVGERMGIPIEGFDYGNSPSALADLDLTGRRIIHRTTAGTQGAIRSRGARRILTTGFCNASATARLALSGSPSSITLVQTELLPNGNGDEDAACADFLEASLRGDVIDLDSLKTRTRNSVSGRKFTNPPGSSFPAADLEAALQFDRFDFAMLAHELYGELVLLRTEVP